MSSVISSKGLTTMNENEQKKESLLKRFLGFLQEVEPFVEWKSEVEAETEINPDLSVNAESSNNLSNNETPCSCKDKSKENEAMPVVSEKKKNLIQSLISGKSPFTVASTKALEEMDEPVLEELDKKYKEEEVKPVNSEVETPVTPPASTSDAGSAGTVQVSEQELQDLRQVAAQFKAQQEAIKDNLVKSLLSNPSVSSVYNEKALKEKSVSDLSDLAKVTQVSVSSTATADFGVIPFTSTSSVNTKKDDTAPGPTVSLAERLKQKRNKAS